MPSILVKLSLLSIASSLVLAAPATVPGKRNTYACNRGFGADLNFVCQPCAIGSAWTSGTTKPTPCHLCLTNTYSTTTKAWGCSSNCNLPQYQIVPDPNRVAGQPYGNVGCINLYNSIGHAKAPKA